MKKRPEQQEEKRQSPRYAFDVLSLIYIDPNDSSKKIVGRTSNISAQGAFLYTAEKLPENTPVHVEIYLMRPKRKQHRPKIEVIKTSADVVRTESNGMAINFTEEIEPKLSSLEEIAGSIL